ncbi:MAG: hypothetical protein ACYCYM_13595 [Saccharofermentanales bacterium]
MGRAREFIEEIKIGTEAYDLYFRLTTLPDVGHIVIGRGEASAIALAKANSGIVASNNLRDISLYIQEFKLHHLTTGNILVEAYSDNYISELEGNKIWAAMLAKRRKLGKETFTDYLNSR